MARQTESFPNLLTSNFPLPFPLDPLEVLGGSELAVEVAGGGVGRLMLPNRQG